MEVRQDSSILGYFFPPLRMHTFFFFRWNLKILLSNIRLYTWHICQNRFESCSVIIKKTGLRGVFMRGLKMLRYFISFLKVTCLGNSNFWTQFIFQTTSDYFFLFSFPENLLSYSLHFSKPLLNTYYVFQALC